MKPFSSAPSAPYTQAHNRHAMLQTRRGHLMTLLAAACLPLSAHAQNAASKPITMVVTYPAGGPADVSARHLESVMRQHLNQTIITYNLPGASGAIGIDRVLSGPKDGSMILFGTPSDLILAPLALAAVKHQPEQMRMVGMATLTPLLLASGMQLPEQNLQELIDSRKKAGAKPLSYGSMGTGSMPHFAGEDFAATTQLEMTHIPYTGIAPLVQDLIGGQIDLGFLPIAGNTLDFVKQGKLRPYAVSTTTRLGKLPEIPTVAEVTGNPNFNFDIWGGIFVPPSVPMEEVLRINAAVNATLADADYQSKIEGSGAAVGHRLSIEEAEQFYANEISKLRAIAQTIALEAQ